LSDIFLEGKGKCEVDTTKGINAKYDLKVGNTKDVTVPLRRGVITIKLRLCFCFNMVWNVFTHTKM
jgi:hypothetical protein